MAPYNGRFVCFFNFIHNPLDKDFVFATTYVIAAYRKQGGRFTHIKTKGYERI